MWNREKGNEAGSKTGMKLPVPLPNLMLSVLLKDNKAVVALVFQKCNV